MFVYWWGLSNLETDPIPSQIRLTSEQENQIWSKEKEVGTPRIKSVTPYGYILSFACNVNKGQYATECMEEYPGLRLSAIAVKRQVGNKLQAKVIVFGRLLGWHTQYGLPEIGISTKYWQHTMKHTTHNTTLHSTKNRYAIFVE